MRHWHWDHGSNGFWYGYARGRWWCAVSRAGKATYVDIATWRFRWAGPDFRPLFSERNGYGPKWHKVGRLGLRCYRDTT